MNYGGYDAYGDGGAQGGNTGGFMAPTQGDGGFGGQQGYGTSSQNTPRKNKSRDLDALIPLTVHQIGAGTAQEQPDDVFRVDGVELKHVKLIGKILNLENQSTNVNFMLSDGTGIIQAKQFLTDLNSSNDGYQPEGEAQSREDELRNGMTVKCVGNLRSYQGDLSLSCFKIQPVTDYNEVTAHMLECIYTHLQNTRGPAGGASNTNAGATNTNTPMKQGTDGFNMLKTPTQQFSGMQMGQQPNFDNAGDDLAGFTKEQQLVLQALGTSDSDTGLSIQVIVGTLQSQLNEPQIRTALNYLVNEGHVYSTIDEDHYKRTE